MGAAMKAEISWVPNSLFSSFEEQRGPQHLVEWFLFPLGSAKVQSLEVRDVLKSRWEQQRYLEHRTPAGLGTRAWGGRDTGQG